MRCTIAAAALLLAAAPAAAGVQVRYEGGLVQLSADSATIAEVLDALARETGMKVEYEGSPPRLLVTLRVAGRTPAEAVLELLEGQALNYAAQLDPTGTRVERLLMLGAATPGTRPPAPARRPEPEPIDEPTIEEAPPDSEVLDPGEDTGETLEGEEPLPEAPPEPVYPSSPFTPRPAGPLRPTFTVPTATPTPQPPEQ